MAAPFGATWQNTTREQVAQWEAPQLVEGLAHQVLLPHHTSVPCLRVD